MKARPALLVSGTFLLSARAQSPAWGQCGGVGWTGATTCASGSACQEINAYYFQCIPGATPTTPPTSVTPSSPSSSPSGPSSTPPPSAGKLRFAGINISGFDFGCNTDGSCTASAAWPPLTQYYGHDGQGQMQHFVNDDGFNVFRLPVGWQFLTNDVLGADVDQDNLTEYDALVQACLATGAHCIIDIHNYARWNKAIIGQGGPTNDQFAKLWSQLASKYASTSNIIFGVMNEPHDVPDINAWAASVQAAVTAIRNAGATSQIILLPGNNWTSAETFVSNGSAAALSTVTNPDGSITNLIFDVHKYLDYDNSGTNPDCTTNNIDNAWAPLATWLRANGRQAFNTETGGGNTASCEQYLCEQVAFQAQNSDVILGYVGWAAGNFDPSYVLGETPTNNGGRPFRLPFKLFLVANFPPTFCDSVMSKRSRESFDVVPAATTPGPPSKRLQTDPPVSSPSSSRSSTSMSTPQSISTPRTPFSIPSDSPSNPFGLKKSLFALDIPPPIAFGKHIVLRFRFVQEQPTPGPSTPRARKLPIIYRVAQVPTNYTFRHLHKLIFFLFASDVGRHHSVRAPTPRAAKGKARAVGRAQSMSGMLTPSGRKRRALAAAASEPVLHPESWTGHAFEVYKASKERPLVSDDEQTKGVILPTGSLWRKLSSVRERHIFRDLYDAADTAKPDDGEDDDGNGDWAWEAEDDLTLAHLWPKGPSLSRAIIYRHNPRISIHIAANKGTVPHRKGTGNLPYVFYSQGSAGDTIQISHDVQNHRRSCEGHTPEASDELPTPPSSAPTTSSQMNRWNAAGVFTRFLKCEDDRERRLRGLPPLLLADSDRLISSPLPPSDDVPFPSSDTESDSDYSAYSDSVLFPFAGSAITPFPSHPAHRKRVQSAERRLERLTRNGLSESKLFEDDDDDKRKVKEEDMDLPDDLVFGDVSPESNPFEDFVYDEAEV